VDAIQEEVEGRETTRKKRSPPPVVVLQTEHWEMQCRAYIEPAQTYNNQSINNQSIFVNLM